MFIADDVLMFPFKSLLSICQKIHNAALQEITSESDAIRAELSQLYLALEAGSLSEAAFDARESELLDRLDELDQRGLLEAHEDDENEEDDEDDEDDEDEDDGHDYVYEESADSA